MCQCVRTGVISPVHDQILRRTEQIVSSTRYLAMNTVKCAGPQKSLSICYTVVYDAFNFLLKTNQVSSFNIHRSISIYDRNCSYYVINIHRRDFMENFVGMSLLRIASFFYSPQHKSMIAQKTRTKLFWLFRSNNVLWEYGYCYCTACEDNDERSTSHL